MLKFKRIIYILLFISFFSGPITVIRAQTQDDLESITIKATFDGIILQANGQYLEAINLYDFAIQSNPNSISVCILYDERGKAKLALNDYLGALTDFTIALEKNIIGASKTHFERGKTKHFLGDYRGAILDYNKSLLLNIDVEYKEEILMWRGFSKFALRDCDEALLDLNIATAINSRNSLAAYLKGMVLICLYKMEEGCTELSRAGELGYYEAYEAIRTHCNR